jgi:DNA-binding MarR family transcriptional regulator
MDEHARQWVNLEFCGGKVNKLNEFQNILDMLGSIVGHQIIRNEGLSVILCLVGAIDAREEIDLATMSERTNIRPASLNRYIELLKHAGVVELSQNAAQDQSTIRIRLSENARQQVSQLFNDV